ncbi:YqgQ family protein [Companilactobacillus sp. HBUAS56275]|uniref:YqgQ family protein n=1 Tax=Candidatus Companilactobacillus pullicola TaxID=2838523 RepID=A0A9D2CNB3_9LACO|nr:YqgQ family protein [Candidatus Companilactobacillus pullicola]
MDEMSFRTLYDVQQLLKRYGTFVHLGKRKWDIELMFIEVKRLYESKMIDKKTFINAQLVLKREHRIEEEKEKDRSK